MHQRLISFALVMIFLPQVALSDQDVFFDPETGQALNASQLKVADSNLLFELGVNDLILGELSLLQEGEQWWVNLDEFLSVLDFPIQYSQPLTNLELNAVSAQGWFIREEQAFELKAKESLFEVVAGDKRFELPFTEVRQKEELVYFPLAELMQWFDFRFQADRQNLHLQLIFDQPLPIESKVLRAKRGKSQTFYSQSDLQFPRQDEAYQAFSPILADVQLTAANNTLNENRYGVSLLGSGDLAYMTGRYFFNHTAGDAISDQTTFRLSLERNSIDADLLGDLQATHVSFGDISPTSIQNLTSSPNNVGFRLSNRPYGRITNTSVVTIRGFQQPGWDVELYLNNILLETQTIGDDGQYSFLNQALSVGENLFTLKFYGPQGQREERTEVYTLDQNALVGGKLLYDLSLSQENWQLSDYFDAERVDTNTQYRFNLHLEKGITDQVSLTTDLSRLRFVDGSEHIFVQPGLRLFAKQALINASLLKDLEAGHLANVHVSRGFGKQRQHKLNITLNAATEDFAIDAIDNQHLKSSYKVALSGPIKLAHSRLNYGLSSKFIDFYTGQSQQNYQANFGMQLGQIRLGHNLSYTRLQDVQSLDTNSNSLSGNLQLSGLLQRVSVRSNLAYNIRPENELSSAILDFAWNFNASLRAQWRNDYNFLTDEWSQAYDLSWLNKNFVTSVGIQNVAGDLSGRLSLRFSLGHDPIKNELFANHRRMSNTAALSALVFEDLNNNQHLDEGEPLIENAEVQAPQQHKKALTDEQGRALITGLYATSATDIQLNAESLEDPLWIPSMDGISFLARPGLVKTLLIPVVSSGEVEGTISLAKELFAKPEDIPRIPVVMTHLKTGKTYATESQFDGFFLIDKLPPGTYSLAVPQAFLQKYQLQTRHPVRVEIGARGSLLVGANFKLVPLNFYQPRSASKAIGHLYAVDLGSFLSRKNAKLVLETLRSVFPNVFREFEMRQPLEVLLTEKQGRYQLLLGPFADLNPALELCKNLAQENLHCELIKEVANQDVVNKQINHTPPSFAQKLTTQIPTMVAIKPETAPNSKPPSPAPLAQLDEMRTFSIQLLSVQDRANLDAFIKTHQLEHTQIFEVEKNGQRFYSLTVGLYATRDAANKDAKIFSKRLGIKPWVRPLDSFSPL